VEKIIGANWIRVLSDATNINKAED
jgi:hypothetical protein